MRYPVRTLAYLVIIPLCVSGFYSRTIFAQTVDTKPSTTIRSLRFEQTVDLGKIFRSARPDEPAIPPSAPGRTRKPALQLVGTLIMHHQKIAWVKFNEQLYLVENGQLIPGLQARVSEIHPESMVVSHTRGCDQGKSCDFVYAIRERLF